MSFRVRYNRPLLPRRVEVWGLPVYWIPADEPLVYFGAVWDAPALKSYPAGLRRLLLALLKRENARYPEGKLSQALYRLGWEMEWNSSRDSIFLTAEGLSENLTSALDLLYQSIALPVLRGPAVQKHLDRLIQEEIRARANPVHLASSRLGHYLWAPSYSWTGSVPIEALMQIETSQLQHYYERFLLRGLKAIVIVAPNFPPQLGRWAEWHKGVSYELPVPLEYPSVKEALPHAGASQVSLRLAYKWFRPVDDLYAYYRLAMVRLGGYFGALLMQSVREEGGLTYGIYARAEHAVAGSFMVIATEVALDRTKEAISRICESVAGWHADPFPDNETLMEVRNYTLLQSMPETPMEWAGRLLRFAASDFAPELFIAQMEAIDALEKVEDFPALSLPREPLIQLAVGTEAPIFATVCV